MPAYNFQARFADDVESGRKRQTIRRKRKRPTRPGDTLYLYTGMRTKACRKLREAMCQRVTDITIHPGLAVTLNSLTLTLMEINELARDDGFDGLVEFYRFFEGRYNLPFEGELIEW